MHIYLLNEQYQSQSKQDITEIIIIIKKQFLEIELTDYMSEINNTQIDNAKDIDLLIPMYNLIELNPHNLQNNYYLKII